MKQTRAQRKLNRDISAVTRKSQLALRTSLKDGALTPAAAEEMHSTFKMSIRQQRELVLAICEIPPLERTQKQQEFLRFVGQYMVEVDQSGLSLFLELSKQSYTEGEHFRRVFMTMTPGDVTSYLKSNRVDAWWLAGFSGDPAMLRRMRENSKRPRHREPKWNAEVRAVAERAYREWVRSASQPHPAWEPSWAAFAQTCIQLIKRETGVDVPAEALRRSILPAKRFPRPQ